MIGQKRLFTDEYLELVNEIVPRATPVGAYCVGILSVLTWGCGFRAPTRTVLEAAAAVRTMTEAMDWFETLRAIYEARP